MEQLECAGRGEPSYNADIASWRILSLLKCSRTYKVSNGGNKLSVKAGKSASSIPTSGSTLGLPDAKVRCSANLRSIRGAFWRAGLAKLVSTFRQAQAKSFSGLEGWNVKNLMFDDGSCWN